MIWWLLFEISWYLSFDFKVICGGEELLVELVWELSVCVMCFWNVYGLMEIMIWLIVCEFMGFKLGWVLIGMSIVGIDVFLFDGNL